MSVVIFCGWLEIQFERGLLAAILGSTLHDMLGDNLVIVHLAEEDVIAFGCFGQACAVVAGRVDDAAG